MKRLLSALLIGALCVAPVSPAFADQKKPLVVGSNGQPQQLPSGTTLTTQASGPSAASINIPHGNAPTSPNNGDIWTSSVGVYARINGATVGPMAPGPSVSPNNTIRSNISGSSGVALDNTPSAVFDSALCNTPGYHITRGSSNWACMKGSPVNPVWWGADPTGTNDSTAALVAARAVSDNIEFPPGKFRFNSASTLSLTGAKTSLSIRGAGADLTTLYFPTTAGLTFALSSQSQSVHLADFSITTGGAANGDAIKFTNSSAFIGTFVAQTDITRVTCRGDDGYGVNNYWSICVNVQGVTDITFQGFNAYGDSTALHGTGIYLNNPSGSAANNCLAGTVTCGTTYLIAESNFSFLGQGIYAGTNVQSISVDTSFIAQVENGIVVGSGATTLQGLNVTNLHCFAYRRCLIALSSQPNLQVVGGYFNVAAGYYAIEVASAMGTVVGATFFPRTTPNPVGSGAIHITAPTSTCDASGTAVCTGPFVITGNSMSSIGTGVLIDSGVSQVMVTGGNYFNNLTAQVTDNAGGNYIGYLTQSPISRVGYVTGAGGTVTQATSKTTAVTLNKPTGEITTNNAALGAGAEVGFAFNNSLIGAKDVLSVQVGNGNYDVRATDCFAGQCTVRLKNVTAGSLSDAVVIRYAILAGATS